MQWIQISKHRQRHRDHESSSCGHCMCVLLKRIHFLSIAHSVLNEFVACVCIEFRLSMYKNATFMSLFTKQTDKQTNKQLSTMKQTFFLTELTCANLIGWLWSSMFDILRQARAAAVVDASQFWLECIWFRFIVIAMSHFSFGYHEQK